jgi:hypothetical protein
VEAQRRQRSVSPFLRRLSVALAFSFAAAVAAGSCTGPTVSTTSELDLGVAESSTTLASKVRMPSSVGGSGGG